MNGGSLSLPPAAHLLSRSAVGHETRWRTAGRWVGPAISLLVLLAVAFQLRSMNFARLAALIPTSAPFWLAFAGYYLATPIAEWVIFRGLWRLPVGGVAPLLRKQVTNQLVLGYMGEAQFYLWARARTGMVASPFGAIKDVAVLSALAGNIATIVALVFAYPLLSALKLGTAGLAFSASVALVMTVSVVLTVFGRRVFSLRRPALLRILIMHLVRVVATVMLSATMWHLLLPAVAAQWWVLLAAVRLMLSRLPFVPSKDVALAGVAAFVVGRDLDVAAAIALVASLMLAAHVLIGAVLGAADLVRREERS